MLDRLKDENNEIREDLKRISKALSSHINKQLRIKSNINVDEDKEIKFMDGNIINARKRLEIVEYEYQQMRWRLSKQDQVERQNNLKKTTQDIDEQ